MNTLTRELWQWCIRRNIWVSACHLPGKINVEADQLSRSNSIDLEWKLNSDVFDVINYIYGPHDLDLFASRINHQLPRYVSFLPDPHAEAVDAFSIKWTNVNAFAFPPFSLVGNVVQKMIAEESDLTLIAPLWKTQHWFPTVLHCIVEDSYLIPKRKSRPLLIHPTDPSMKHPLKTLTLGVFRLSGKCCKIQDYQKKLQKLSTLHGDSRQVNNIGRISKDGVYFAAKDRLIFLRPLKWK